MRFIALVCAGLIAAGCGRAPAPAPADPEQFSAEQIRAALPGITDECVERLQSDDTRSPPTDQCFEMQEPRPWRGLWRNVFEGSRFCPEPARECGHDTPGERIWLTFSEHLPQSGFDDFGGLYEMEFVGRRTLNRGHHGHFSQYYHALVVDRVTSMREIEAPPAATSARGKAWEKECEASPECFTSNELKAAGLLQD